MSVGYTIIVETDTEMYTMKDGNRVLVYSISEAMRIRREMKAKGYGVQLVPIAV